MDKKPKFLELNSIVSKHFNLQTNIKRKLKTIFDNYRRVFKKYGYQTIALGEFGCKTLTKYEKIELEIAVVKYLPKIITGLREKMFQNIASEICKNSNYTDSKNTQNDGYLEYLVEEEVTIKVRIIPFCYKNNNGKLDYFFWRNGVEKTDNMIQVVQHFNKANKISNNLLRCLVKLIKYVLKEDFAYYYILYTLVLRWFYEYFIKCYDAFLQKIDTINRLEKKDLEKYNDINYQKNWFSKNIDGEELIFYILERFWRSETYYFREFEFIEEEIFESISRYSWYTNSVFLTPYDYYVDFKIYNIKEFNDLNIVQNELKNSQISRIQYDYCRSHDLGIYVTPIKIEGVVGFIDYAINFKKKATELFKKLDPEKRKDAISVNQREIMEELNLIAHKWLTTYRQKLTYIKTYFDRKYPILSGTNYYMKIQAIISSVDNLKNDDYIIGYDT
ncbi:hypothetical protein P344_04515 [Spiroplasma mirum ATCC 29335]|uniref:Uncharacterized protein n=1 Tax=Spiroplasma mirum ATCC 29335 TaxID=838561 RepID=W0GLX0_9MOLU|nr:MULTISPECIES: hypothetical protein [Spiroplasma]AHF61157.1 hypothetical protein SMM_0750 [Spiroplasma mirum ATCC 29335]AHI58225.1 hypothetical protein P344_04515 [Spiroplasma mirum ATCC 29335]AKM53259.1 hypothetical protein SATRI_v1c08170 [Spiroplasma atrichopogonis]